MCGLSRFWEKVNTMGEGGSRYCSKKSDDVCGDACGEMHTLSKGDLLPKIIEAYSRPTRIVRGKGVTDGLKVDETAFETVEERALWSTFTSLRSKIHPDMEVDDFVEASFDLVQPLEDFFNSVFVMVEDERIRKNRLGLLRKISDLPKGIVDLSIFPSF